MGAIRELTLLTITDDLTCNGVEYKTNPQILGFAKIDNIDMDISFENNYRNDQTTNNRMGFYITETSGYMGISTVGIASQNETAYTIIKYPNDQSSAYAKMPLITYWDSRYNPPAPFPVDYIQGDYNNNTASEFSTNFPIFESIEDLKQYIQVGDNITDAINYDETESVPDGMDFELRVGWTTARWDKTNIPPTPPFAKYVGFRGRLTSGRLCLYHIAGIRNGRVSYGIKNDAIIYDLELLEEDGMTWTPAVTIPYNFVYRKRLNEIGLFSYAFIIYNNKIPIFGNENDADDYIEGTKPIWDADNWDDISPNYPPENPTGDPDEETEFGEVYTKSFFSQQYICSESALFEISNAFFDTSQGGAHGIFDDIKKGLEMYGENVASSIQSVMFYPIDLTTVFANTMPQNYIYFGGYKFDMQHTVNKIIFPNGYKDIGSFYLASTFGKENYRNYAPYQRLYVFLPYCGWYELDTARYIGKTVNVRYYFDTRTGMCLACLLVGGAHGLLVDYFQGQCGVQMPLTVTDYTAYANSQIQTLLTGGKNGIEAGTGTYNAITSLAEAGALTVGTGAVMGSVGALGLGIQASKTVYGLTTNNINNYNITRGASSSMLNQYLPQNVCFMFEIQESDETPLHRELLGYPSNASGQIQSFSGYLEVDTVNLVCSGATANEKAEIIKMLQNGVYI